MYISVYHCISSYSNISQLVIKFHFLPMRSHWSMAGWISFESHLSLLAAPLVFWEYPPWHPMTSQPKARQGEGLEDAAWLTILEDLTRSLWGDPSGCTNDDQLGFWRSLDEWVYGGTSSRKLGFIGIWVFKELGDVVLFWFCGSFRDVSMNFCLAVAWFGKMFQLIWLIITLNTLGILVLDSNYFLFGTHSGGI